MTLKYRPWLLQERVRAYMQHLFQKRLARDPAALSVCTTQVPLIHFISDSLTYSMPLFVKLQCDRTLGAPRPLPAPDGAPLRVTLRQACHRRGRHDTVSVRARRAGRVQGADIVHRPLGETRPSANVARALHLFHRHCVRADCWVLGAG